MPPNDERLAGIDLEKLITRAQVQHALVEERRVLAAQTAFSNAPS